ncbi:hypothetical protein [Aeromonas caviae]|uniref:hypothetical protein n=1 Tax=Aeromonas caviae TaxID=648 RepID=UPI00385F99EB
MKKTLSTDFPIDQKVVCPDPKSFVSPIDKYLTGRVGVVIEITPPKVEGDLTMGMRIPNRVHVRWLKKGNRGKEKTMWLNPRDLAFHEPEQGQD